MNTNSLPVPTTGLSELDALVGILISACIAGMGGLVRMFWVTQQYSLIRFFAGALTGVFCGVLAAFACKNFGVGLHLTMATAGLAGYIGTPLLDLAGEKLKKRLADKADF